MKLYRVFPYNANAAVDQPGGALFLPVGGFGRFDNATLYRAFYSSLEPEGAIIERFGDFDTWHPNNFFARIAAADEPLPLSIATYEADITIVNLARVEQLRELGVERVTEIVTRNRTSTQDLAARAFETLSDRAGLAWWSFHVPEWTNVMLWRSDGLQLLEAPQPLGVKHPLVIETAHMAHRQIG